MPPASRTRDRAASAGVSRGGGEGRGGLGAPVAAQLTGELWTGRSRDPEAGGALGAPGALGGSPVRVVSCVRHRSASALAPARWLRAGSALLTWDPEPETPLAFSPKQQSAVRRGARLLHRGSSG
ncbi:hypothetical protein NDU88_004163 [Pleurodeles waltl]|uniref:Uncharacterized protein n=1 Tax=Pleurodeles waltl TaxID=8319 RepID=A0AAV7VI22_PLEWA|nr:hypothetical protein NDU88_004163 [Pleurodeles waltl]